MTEAQSHPKNMHHTVRRQSIAMSSSSGGFAAAVRRASYLQVGGTRRMSLLPGRLQPAHPVKLENTYQLEPQQKSKFRSECVKREISDFLEMHLRDQKYDAKECSQTCAYLSDALKTRVKDLGFERYKLVTIVTIACKTDQGFHETSRCLWDSSTDTSATATYENESLLAVALVFGIYFD